MSGRASREAVARWNVAYSEHTTALFAAAQPGADDVAVIRLSHGYAGVAVAWRVLAAELAVPLWARHAASIAAEEFVRRADVEALRVTRRDEGGR